MAFQTGEDVPQLICHPIQHDIIPTKKPISRQSQRRHEQTAAKNSVFTMKEAAPKKNTALESKAAAQ
jgi:hypothetical protein